MKRARFLARACTLAVVAIVVTGSSCHTNWGFERIETMTTPSDPSLTCPVTLRSDSLAAALGGCTFRAGARVSATLGIPPDVSAAIPIRHVIVMMKENRSFDHIFGKLHDEGQPGVESVPASYVNPDNAGVAIAPFHASTTCIALDPAHQSSSMMAAVGGGAMKGFVKNAAATTGTDGHFAMAEYDRSDLPFYYWLASTYAVGDRHFAPMQSGTFGARNFLIFGTNAGVVDTGISLPDPNTNSILRSLMNTGHTWGAYSDSEPFSGALGWSKDDPGVHPMRNLFDALDRGALPNVVFVDGVEAVEDDHPTADLQVGEAWTKKIYDHLVRSPQWPRTALLFTYDECGGFADHVPPANGCLPGDPLEWPFPELGPRVPLVAISPWAKRNYVSHVVHDHAAITRFIEAIFDLPALTARDANSDALFDLFDFSCGRDMTPPAGAPDPGMGGCTK